MDLRKQIEAQSNIFSEQINQKKGTEQRQLAIKLHNRKAFFRYSEYRWKRQKLKSEKLINKYGAKNFSSTIMSAPEIEHSTNAAGNYTIKANLPEMKN